MKSKVAILLPPVIVGIVSFAVYFNAMSGGFILDDYSQVLKNPLIRDIKHIPEIFCRSAWTFEGAPPASNYYRPMLNLLYMLNYHVFGLQAWGFHLTNILFHTGNSILVFLIMARLFGGVTPTLLLPPQGGGDQSKMPLPGWEGWGRGPYLSPPFIAALLFAVHPVNTEAVNWIAGLSDVSLTLFYLLSLYLYLCSRGSYNWNYVFSVVSFLVAILCKEPGLTLPVILIAYDYAFKRGPALSLESLKRYSPYLIVTCGYFVVRFCVLGGFSPLQRLGGLSTFQYIMNVLPLFSQYLNKLVLPVNLNFWPDYDPIKSLFSADGIISLCLSAIFTGGVIVALKKNKVVFLSLLLVIVPLAPAFHLKGIVGKLFSERYLYLSSFGFAMLLASVFSLVKTDRPRVTKGLTIGFALLIGIYLLGTISRNTVWKDEYTLFSDTVKKSPNSVVPRMELGNALLVRGQLDEAIVQYLAAMRMEPNLYVIHHHLGLALAGMNRLYDAVDQYQIAIKLNPGRPQIHEDLGRALASARFRDGAVGAYETAVALQPTASRYNLLAIAYAQKGQIDKAIEKFRTANSLDPTHAKYSRNLARAIELEGPLTRRKTSLADLGWEYDERTVTSSEIFSFVW